LNSCCVFVGKLKTAFACPKCGARRYKECVRFDCKGKGKKDDCDHHTWTVSRIKTYFIVY
jgi:predicted nucleic-acid-binding Zn-ribbon protein